MNDPIVVIYLSIEFTWFLENEWRAVDLLKCAWEKDNNITKALIKSLVTLTTPLIRNNYLSSDFVNLSFRKKENKRIVSIIEKMINCFYFFT